jgi:hypothetical protein
MIDDAVFPRPMRRIPSSCFFKEIQVGLIKTFSILETRNVYYAMRVTLGEMDQYDLGQSSSP